MNPSEPLNGPFARAGRWLVPLVLLAVAAVAVRWRLLQAAAGIDLFSDDAYYYTIVARNFVETGRFTFDGSSLTNGFHPLLFWLEAAGFSIFGTGAPPMVQYLGIFAGVATIFLLTILGCLLIAGRPARSQEDAVIRGALLITVCVILVPRFTAPFLGGMEAILVLPLAILFGILAWEARYLPAGICGLMLVMARLDTLPYVVLPISLACAWRHRERGRTAIRSGLQVALPAIVGTSALMLWHQSYFGHPMPIHGVLKSCFPRVHLQWQQVLPGPLGSTTLPMAFLAAAVALGLLIRRGKIGPQARGAGMTVAVLALLQLAAFALFQKWSKPVPVWYFGPAVLAGTFALAVGIANIVGLRRMRLVTSMAVIGVVALNVASLTRAWYRTSQTRADAGVHAREVANGPGELVDFMKKQPSSQVWACTDCGKLAFWSSRRVVNLDGLVNGFDYQDDLRDGRLARHLLDKNVKYLICIAWDRPQTDGRPYEPMYTCRVDSELFAGNYGTAEFYVYSYKYMKYSDRIRLPRRAEVWRSAPARDGRAMARTVVFDLDVALRGSVPAAGRMAASNSTNHARRFRTKPARLR